MSASYRLATTMTQCPGVFISILIDTEKHPVFLFASKGEPAAPLLPLGTG